MSEHPQIPEAVALELLKIIGDAKCNTEKAKRVKASGNAYQDANEDTVFHGADKEGILQIYAECLATVKNSEGSVKDE